jgi:hypothetical protein
MADTFLLFSEQITDITPEEAAWLDRQLEPVCFDGRKILSEGEPSCDGNRTEHEIPRFLAEAILDPTLPGAERIDRDWEWTEAGFEVRHCPEDRTYWFYSEQCANLDHLAHLWQKFLRTFRPEDCLSATWGLTCTRPRIGAFGGGAVFVTAERICTDDCYLRVDRWHRRFERVRAAKRNTQRET